MYTETLWEFETDNFLIKLEISPSECPDTSWMDEEQLAEYESDNLVFFDSTCTVYGPRREILGQDHLGESCYYSEEAYNGEFVKAHRNKNPMNRNCSIMRAKKGGNVSICHYFPDMVRIAVAEARETIKATMDNYETISLRH